MHQVAELRAELEARGSPSKGLKSQLLARLSKALKGEQEQEAEKEKQKAEAEEEEEAKPSADEDQKQLEVSYSFYILYPVGYNRYELV